MMELIWLVIIVIVAIVKISNNDKKKNVNNKTRTNSQWNSMNGSNPVNKSVTQASQRVNSTIQKTVQNYVPKEMKQDIQKAMNAYAEQKKVRNTKAYQNPYENAGKNTQKTKAFGENTIERNVIKDFKETTRNTNQEKAYEKIDPTDLNAINISSEYLFPQVKMSENLKDIETILTCGYSVDAVFTEEDISRERN